MTDLFGVADAFVGDDAPNVGIEDLVPGGPSRSPSPRAAPSSSSSQSRASKVDAPAGSALAALASLKKGRK